MSSAKRSNSNNTNPPNSLNSCSASIQSNISNENNSNRSNNSANNSHSNNNSNDNSTSRGSKTGKNGKMSKSGKTSKNSSSSSGNNGKVQNRGVPQTPNTAKNIGLWKKGKLIGRGASGTVYQAYLQNTHQNSEIVAVKQMQMGGISEDELGSIENEIEVRWRGGGIRSAHLHVMCVCAI